MPDMYKLGVSDALTRLGLTQPPEESHLGRNLALGGLAAAPFAGLIGRQKLIHDPYAGANIPKTEKIRDLAKQMRAGDVLISGSPEWGSWKVTQSPFTGSHFYHADQVVAPERYFLAGERFVDPKDKQFWRNGEFLKEEYEKAKRYAEGLPPRRAIWQASNIQNYPELGYHETVLLRPKKPLTPEDIANIKRVATQRAQLPYQMGVGSKGVLKEIFLPKSNALQRLWDRLRGNVVCKGNVCSTYPAQTLSEAGIIDRVVRGKQAPSTLSADFLRSEAFEPVLHYQAAGKASRMSQKALQRLGLLARGGLGLGMAGAAYGLTEDPLLALGAAGAGLTPAAARAIIDWQREKKLGPKKFKALEVTPGKEEVPKLKALFKAFEERHMKGKPGELARRILRRTGTRTIPLALAGGLATYLGAKGIQKAIQSE